jgi:hypothetical protein
MAKPAKKRIRRTDDQLIADLQAEIERLKHRAQARKAKKSPELKATLDAVRSIDTALKGAADGTLKRALAEAREPLVAYLQMEGIAMPKKRGPKTKAERAELASAPEKKPGKSRSAAG